MSRYLRIAVVLKNSEMTSRWLASLDGDRLCHCKTGLYPVVTMWDRELNAIIDYVVFSENSIRLNRQLFSGIQHWPEPFEFFTNIPPLLSGPEFLRQYILV